MSRDWGRREVTRQPAAAGRNRSAISNSLIFAAAWKSYSGSFFRRSLADRPAAIGSPSWHQCACLQRILAQDRRSTSEETDERVGGERRLRGDRRDVLFPVVEQGDELIGDDGLNAIFSPVRPDVLLVSLILLPNEIEANLAGVIRRGTSSLVGSKLTRFLRSCRAQKQFGGDHSRRRKCNRASSGNGDGNVRLPPVCSTGFSADSVPVAGSIHVASYDPAGNVSERFAIPAGL